MNAETDSFHPAASDAVEDFRDARALSTAAPRFQWCCENGCGPCDVKRVEFEYSRTETLAGALIESKTIPRLVSRCCGAELSMWDNDRDEQIDVAVAKVLLP